MLAYLYLNYDVVNYVYEQNNSRNRGRQQNLYENYRILYKRSPVFFVVISDCYKTINLYIVWPFPRSSPCSRFLSILVLLQIDRKR